MDPNRIEQQISQLISMVAKNNEMLSDLKVEVIDLKSQFTHLKVQSEQEIKENKARHEELVKEIRNQNYVINHHREKIAKNEEDISMIRQIMQI